MKCFIVALQSTGQCFTCLRPSICRPRLYAKTMYFMSLYSPLLLSTVFPGLVPVSHLDNVPVEQEQHVPARTAPTKPPMPQRAPHKAHAEPTPAPQPPPPSASLGMLPVTPAATICVSRTCPLPQRKEVRRVSRFGP